MAHEVEAFVPRFKEIRAASAANGGTALTTTFSLISIPLGSEWVSVTPRNFVGCNVVRFTLNPFLYVVWTTTALAGAVGSGYPTQDISAEMQDGDTTNFAVDSWNTAANNGYLYVGGETLFRGVAVDIGTGPNGTASLLTVKYWNSSSWVSIAETDGTETGGTTTMAQDGNVTWTIPTGWVKASLNAIGSTTAGSDAAKSSFAMTPCYWTRWEVDTQLDSDVDIAQIRALNRSTAYAELLEGQPFEQMIVSQNVDGIAVVEALTDAGTANVVVNVATKHRHNFT